MIVKAFELEGLKTTSGEEFRAFDVEINGQHIEIRTLNENFKNKSRADLEYAVKCELVKNIDLMLMEKT